MATEESRLPFQPHAQPKYSSNFQILFQDFQRIQWADLTLYAWYCPCLKLATFRWSLKPIRISKHDKWSKKIKITDVKCGVRRILYQIMVIIVCGFCFSFWFLFLQKPFFIQLSFSFLFCFGKNHLIFQSRFLINRFPKI